MLIALLSEGKWRTLDLNSQVVVARILGKDKLPFGLITGTQMSYEHLADGYDDDMLVDFWRNNY